MNECLQPTVCIQVASKPGNEHCVFMWSGSAWRPTKSGARESVWKRTFSCDLKDGKGQLLHIRNWSWERSISERGRLSVETLGMKALGKFEKLQSEHIDDFAQVRAAAATS